MLQRCAHHSVRKVHMNGFYPVAPYFVVRRFKPCEQCCHCGKKYQTLLHVIVTLVAAMMQSNPHLLLHWCQHLRYDWHRAEHHVLLCHPLQRCSHFRPNITFTPCRTPRHVPINDVRASGCSAPMESKSSPSPPTKMYMQMQVSSGSVKL